MANQSVAKIVNKVIDDVVADFKTYPDVFLTEEDVRCHIVSKLLSYRTLSNLTQTADGGLSIPIHTEVRWYGESGRLRYRSDIVLLKTNTLKTKKAWHLPTKGFSFDLFDAVIELKLRRIRPRGDTKYIQLIRDDFLRLQRLRMEVGEQVASYHLICFDKKSDLSSHLLEYSNQTEIDFRYIYQGSEPSEQISR